MRQKKHLTWWLSIIGLALLVLAIAGCGGSSSSATMTTATGSVSTTNGTTAAVTPVTAPTGLTVSIPAGTTLTDASNNPVSGTISTSVGYSTSASDLPAAARTLPAGTTLVAFVDISMGTVKYFSNPVSLAINVTSSGAKTGDALVVYSFDSTTNKWTFAGTEIVDANGNISPTVIHLSIWAVFKSTAPPPLKPTGVAVTAGDGQAAVSWTAVTGATSYNVYYGTTAGQETSGTPITVTGTSCPVPALTNSTTYYFFVTAVNSGGESVVSSEVSATPLARPTGVTAATGDTQVTVSWTAASGATSYNIYYSTTSGVTKATATNSVPNVIGTSSTITGLIDGTAYYFVVTAVYPNGESVASSEVSATPITKPSGITVSAENSQATAAWLSVPGATSYNLYYGTTNPVTTSNTKISVTGSAAGTSNGTPYFKQTVPPLTNGSTYYFAVTAVNAGGETVLSSQKSAVPSATAPKPGSPAAVTVTSTVAGQVHLVWGDYVPDTTTYNVYYLQSSTAPTTATVISSGTKVSFPYPQYTSPQDLTGFTSGLPYWFVVSAVNALGQQSGGQSNPKTVTVQ